MPSPPRATRAPSRRPRALRPGSRVALVAPAGPVEPAQIQTSVARCQRLGLEAVVFPSTGARHRYLAGDDSMRLADLQGAFDDREIDAVWALRGGYGTLRILDALDLSRQLEDPIPFIGFSDNTSIHVRHVDLGVISFHGPHPGADWPSETEDAFRRTLFSADPPGTVNPRDIDPTPRSLVAGRVEAPLVGGNLAILASMCGSRHALSAEGCILFLEEVGEAAYRVDRMLLQLVESGVTEGVVGLAFGRFTRGEARATRSVDTEFRGEDARGTKATGPSSAESESSEGLAPHTEQRDSGAGDVVGGRGGGSSTDPQSVIDVLSEYAERLGVPTLAELPFGHVAHNWTMPVGGSAVLDADEGTLTISDGVVEA